jgi:hypothetical protein
MEGARWRPWLAFTLFIGAARADATVAQQEELTRVLTPLLVELRHTNNAEEIMRTVQRVMGPTWAPGDEWRTMISNLLTEE